VVRRKSGRTSLEDKSNGSSTAELSGLWRSLTVAVARVIDYAFPRRGNGVVLRCADTAVTAIYRGAILDALAFKNRASNDHRGARFGRIGGPWAMGMGHGPRRPVVSSQWVADRGCVSGPQTSSNLKTCSRLVHYREICPAKDSPFPLRTWWDGHRDRRRPEPHG
jgi:hypothetical protein